jgi:drug/metabolite transporter (DMT)-like permease
MGLFAAALFGASTPFAKVLLGNGIDPWLLAGLLYSGSGVGLSLVSVLYKRKAGESRLRGGDVGWLLLVILTGGLAAPLLLMVGLAHTSATSASLLLNLEGLATMAIAWIVFKEYVDRRLLLGALAILAGAVLLSFHGTEGFGIGAIAIAAACLGWGIDNNLTRKLSAGDPMQIAAVKGVVAGGLNLSLAVAHGAIWPPLIQIAAAAALGFLGYGVSLVLFVLALRHLGAARTGAYFSTAPFIGALLAIFMLGDAFSVTLFFAAGLMAIGVYLHITENHEHDHAHGPMEHEHRHSHDLHHQHDHRADDPPGKVHAHMHVHPPMIHRHPHYPDLDHRHSH